MSLAHYDIAAMVGSIKGALVEAIRSDAKTLRDELEAEFAEKLQKIAFDRIADIAITAQRQPMVADKIQVIIEVVEKHKQ